MSWTIPRRPPAAMADIAPALSSDAFKMGQIFDLSPSSAGVNVTPETAQRVSAVYACRRLIAGSIASMPLTIYERADGARRSVDHDYWWMLNEQPCPRFTAHSMWEYAISSVLMRGDGLIMLDRAPSGQVRQMIPLKRESVMIYRHGDRKQRLGYRVHGEFGEASAYFDLDQDDVIHLANDTFDGLCSTSVIGTAARSAIGTAYKADEFAGKLYGSGGHVQYAVKSPKSMSPEQQAAFREAFVATYGSGMGPTSRPLMLTEGLEIQQMAMTATDAQFLESRKYQVSDIARAFGVPPHMIGETSASTSWGSGIEQMSIGFVVTTLMPHMSRFKDELNRKLWPRNSRIYCEWNPDSMLQGDSKAQAEYFTKALGGPGAQGWMTINEVRRLKNLPPVDGGEKLIFAGSAPAEGQDNEEPTAEAAGA